MTPMEAQEAAENLCRGSYQRGCVQGNYNLSGSDLKGKASRYGSRYSQSRHNLISRIRQAGIPFRIVGGVAGQGARTFNWGNISPIMCQDTSHTDCMQCDEIAYDCAKRQREYKES